jgi:hypothetical protein
MDSARSRKKESMSNTDRTFIVIALVIVIGGAYHQFAQSSPLTGGKRIWREI